MTLKIIRFTEPREAAEEFGFLDMLVDFEELEVLNAYYYDTQSMFSLDRIKFKPNRIQDLDKILKEKLDVEWFELLRQQKDEVWCILKQRREVGFFNIMGHGPWAFLFPITVRSDIIQFQILAEEQYVSSLYETLSKYTDLLKVTSISNVAGIKDLDQFGHFKMPTPAFTTKQREIASFAAQHGYFKSPKQVSAKAISEHFGITESAVNYHLKNAEDLAMAFFFGEP